MWLTSFNYRHELVYMTCSMSVCSRSSMARHRQLQGPSCRHGTVVLAPLRALFCAADWLEASRSS
jgi:hypothetical protein